MNLTGIENIRSWASKKYQDLDKQKDAESKILDLLYDCRAGKAKARRIIEEDETIKKMLETYTMGILFRNVLEYIAWYHLDCPEDFEAYSLQAHLLSLQANGVCNTHALDNLRILSNEVVHIALDDSALSIDKLYDELTKSYYGSNDTDGFESIIHITHERMKNCHHLSNNQFFVVLKSEIDTLMKECINKTDSKGLLWFLFDRPHKPYSATLLLSVFHRRILDAVANKYILAFTHDADLIESRCELTIAEKLGLMSGNSNYSELMEEYWHINRESVKYLHAVVGVIAKNANPEEYFQHCDFEPDDGYSEKSETVYALLCGLLGIFGAHKFYIGKIGMGVFYLFTGGGFGIGLIIDIFKVIFSPGIQDAEGRPLKMSIVGRFIVAVIVILFILLNAFGR